MYRITNDKMSLSLEKPESLSASMKLVVGQQVYIHANAVREDVTLQLNIKV